METKPEVEICYVSLQKATDEQLAGHERLLDKQNADPKRLTAVKQLREILSPIFRAHPGITVEEACEIWKENRAM